jgi:hypothetical protein
MRTGKIVVGLLVVLALGAMAGAASAYDANTPWTGDIKWVVPSDTSFTVTFAGGEDSVDFDNSLSSCTQSGVQPDSQDNTTSTPIITITNAGNKDLNFTCNLTSTIPSWAVLKVSNTTSYADATDFDTTAVLINATVSSGQSTPMYIWTDVTGADEGTTIKTLQINTEASA